MKFGTGRRVIIFKVMDRNGRYWEDQFGTKNAAMAQINELVEEFEENPDLITGQMEEYDEYGNYLYSERFF